MWGGDDVCVGGRYLCQVVLLRAPFVHSNKHTTLSVTVRTFRNTATVHTVYCHANWDSSTTKSS